MPCAGFWLIQERLMEISNSLAADMPLKHDAMMHRTIFTGLKCIDIFIHSSWHNSLKRKALDLQAKCDNLLFSYEYRRIQAIMFSA